MLKKAECWRINIFKLWWPEDSWKSLGLQDQTGQSWKKSTLNSHWKDWCWNWSSNILATWCKELTHWKRLWCWERLRAWGKGGGRGWGGWIASLTLDMSLSKLLEMVKDREARWAADHGVANHWTWLSDWTRACSFLGLIFFMAFISLPKFTFAFR